MQNEFIEWALNPKLGIEEAYGAERLVEAALFRWHVKHKVREPKSYEEHFEARKRRRLNPAHRARLAHRDVERAAEIVPELLSIDLSCFEDRPLRDLSGLRFLLQLEDLRLTWTEISDLSPLAGLTRLHKLHLSDGEAQDLRPLARCTRLRRLSLQLRQPWPVLEDLAGLNQLEEFEWKGNLLLLETVTRLPRVREAKLTAGYQFDLPLRDCRRLPQMPELRVLEIGSIARLEGIDRWPQLRNLVLGGSLRDLRPLQSLRELTHLTVRSEEVRVVSPLAALPELRRLMVVSEHPIDFSSLAETPRLHEVVMERCEINKMELATLNAVLEPWDEEFAAPQPRRLLPATFCSSDVRQFPQVPQPEAEFVATRDADPQLHASECRWFARRLQEKLNQLLGADQWGEVSASEHARRVAWLSISQLDAAERLEEIVQATQETLAGTRWPWMVQINVNLDREEENNDTASDEETEIRQGVAELQELRARRKEKKEYLERLHRMHLKQQEGSEVNPDEFAPPLEALPPEPETPEEHEATPDSIVKLFEDDCSHPLAERLFLFGLITEEGLWVSDRTVRAAEHLLGRTLNRS
jgi:hypothetical protein